MSVSVVLRKLKKCIFCVNCLLEKWLCIGLDFLVILGLIKHGVLGFYLNFQPGRRKLSRNEK